MVSPELMVVDVKGAGPMVDHRPFDTLRYSGCWMNWSEIN